MVSTRAKYFCKNLEDVENYEQAMADKTRVWHCHHRLETHTSDGERRPIDLTPEELKALEVYYNRPANELIFLTIAEHSKLHNKSRKHTKEACLNMSKGQTGKVGHTAWNKGRTDLPPKVHSEQSKKKMSDSHKGKHWKLENGKRVYF